MTANTARIDDKRYSLEMILIKRLTKPNDDVYGVLSFESIISSSAKARWSLFAPKHQLAFWHRDAELLFAGIVGEIQVASSTLLPLHGLFAWLLIWENIFDFAALTLAMDTKWATKLLNCKATSTTIWKYENGMLLALSWVKKS